MQVVEELPHLVLRAVWQLELHVVEPGDDVALSTQGLLDVAHRDLLLSRGSLEDDALAVLVELDDGLHHADRLVEGAVVVVLGEGVLLEELVLDDLGGPENGLLPFRKGVLTDKLHDLSQLILMLEDLTDFFTKIHELWISLGVVLEQDSVVVGETD